MYRSLKLLVCALLTLAAVDARAVNHVTVESKNVAAGATGVQAGVFFENDFEMTALVLALEFRELVPGTGAFMTTSFSLTVPPANRIGSSPLGAAAAAAITSRRIDTTATPPCSGPVSHTFGLGTALGFTSPDALIWASVATTSEPPFGMVPGSDPAGTANASILLTFNVTAVDGYFLIDTCCVRPANHLIYVDLNNLPVIPTFTRGQIKIGNPTFPPVVDDIPDQTIDEGQSFATIALDNFVSDFDHADNQLTWTAAGQTNLIVNISPARVATISTPNANWFGAETITFTARDPGNLTDSDPATFTVRPVNDPPVLTPIGPKQVFAGRSLDFNVSATDVDDVSIDLTLGNAPAGATLSSDGVGHGSFGWTTVCLDSGMHSATIIASDGELADTEIVSINVLPDPDRFDVEPDSLEFTFVLGETLPPLDTFFLSDPGCGELAWEATTTQPWIQVDPDTGTTPSPIVVTIDTAGLAVGETTGAVIITARTTAKSPAPQIQVPIRVTVEAEICDCPCHGDPIPTCDSIFDARDVVWIVNVVFRGFPDLGFATCPVSINDVTCDCVVDVLDVVEAVNYIFRGGTPFCDPCAVDPPCLNEFAAPQ